MSLISFIGKAIILSGPRLVFRGGKIGVGVLASNMTVKGAATPLFRYQLRFGVAGAVSKTTKAGTTGPSIRSLEMTRAVGPNITYGQAGQVVGVGGTIAEDHIARERAETQQEFRGLIAEEINVATSAAVVARVTGAGAVGTYAKSVGPLLLAEGMSYGATGLLSQTQVGQDLGFDEAKSFSDMNFETGRNVGQAVLDVEYAEPQTTELSSIGIDRKSRTIGEKSLDLRDAAILKGSSANPFNYSYGTLGEGALSVGTWAVDTAVRRPAEAAGLI